MNDKTPDWSERFDAKQFVWEVVGQEMHNLRMETARQGVWLTALTALCVAEAAAIALLWWLR